jgi:hypothetical protein
VKYPIPGVRIASTGARGRFSGAHEFRHGGLSYEDEALDGLEAHLSEGGQLGHQNSKAETYYRRALSVFEKSLGPEHPKIAITLDNYEKLLRKMGNTRTRG